MPPRAVQPGPTHVLRLHQAGAVVGTLSQFVLTWTMWTAGERSGLRAHTLLLAIALLALTTGMLRYPSWYFARRHWLLPLARFALYSVPSVHSVGVGSALMLARPASPGARGAASDWLRLVAGTRLLGLIVGDLAMPLRSPAIRAATQAALLLLTRNEAGYCGTQLLRHPLSLERMRRLAGALDYAALPVVALMPGGARSTWILQRDTPPEQLCAATLAMQQVTLGVLLPLLLAAYNWRPEAECTSSAPDAAGAGAAGGAAAADGRRAAQQQRQQRWQQRQCGTWLQVQAGRLHLAANSMLSMIAGTGRTTEAAVATWMLLLGLLWWECRAVAAGL